MKIKPVFSRALTALVCFSACGGWSYADNDGPKAGTASVPYDLGKETYTTQLLFSYDGGAQQLYAGRADEILMERSAGPKVYKGNVYLPLVAHGRSLRIIKVPLNGGDAQIEPVQKGYRISDDTHQYVTVNVDAKGYIHVTGGFHSAPVVQHWVSVKPEDISQFRTTEGTQSPAGTNVTYPSVIRSPDGTLYCSMRIGRPTAQGGHAGGLSSLNAASQTWTMIGADVPKAMGGIKGQPVTVWEDNGESPGIGYNRTGVRFTSDRKKRMHLCFAVLNKTPEALSKESAHVLSDILYAWSDDGGKTIFKSDGSPIQWPVRAEAGPHQAEVLWAGSANPKDPWLVYGYAIYTDWQDRPVIQFQSTRSGLHTLQLKDGKWVDCKPVLDLIGRGGSVCRGHAGVLIFEEAQKHGNPVRAWDADHTRTMDLGLPAKWQFHAIDGTHLRDTGEMIYTVLSPKTPGLVGIMRTVITRPGAEGKTAKP